MPPSPPSCWALSLAARRCTRAIFNRRSRGPPARGHRAAPAWLRRASRVARALTRHVLALACCHRSRRARGPQPHRLAQLCTAGHPAVSSLRSSPRFAAARPRRDVATPRALPCLGVVRPTSGCTRRLVLRRRPLSRPTRLHQRALLLQQPAGAAVFREVRPTVSQLYDRRFGVARCHCVI